MADTPQDAAMLVLMRDGTGAGTQLEVLLMQHGPEATMAAGSYAFPGGLLTPIDSIPPALALSRSLTATEAALRLPDVEPAARALSFWVAALRQTFEQAGILLARYGDGRLWELDRSTLGLLDRQRREIERGNTNFPNMMHDLERALATDLLVYFAHGVTPDVRSQRCVVRFFLADIPYGVSPLPQQPNQAEPLWLTPEEALQRHAHGVLDMPPVTTQVCQLLEPFHSATAAVDHFRWQPAVSLDTAGH